jgi:choline-sulfatase
VRLRTVAITLAVVAAVWLLLPSRRQQPPSRDQRPNVLVVSLDGLRPDRMGAYGAAQSRSPRIDALLAREGTLFTHAYTAAPDGPAASMSLLTGLEPCLHGVSAPDASPIPGVRSLAELLSDAGWVTGGFTDGGHVLGSAAFARGFAVWNDEQNGGAEPPFAAVRRWVRGSGASPWFAFLHTVRLHVPDSPPRGELESPDAERAPAARYDAAVRDVDERLGELLADLRDAGTLDETLVILTAGHGEQLGEHGLWGHGSSLYDTLLHVPLVIRGPSVGVETGKAIDWYVTLVDVVPTVLELLGLPPLPRQSGVSLVPLLHGGAPAPRLLFAEDGRGGFAARQIVSTRFKIIGHRDAQDFRIFHLVKDPDERVDLATQAPADTYAWIGFEGNLAIARGMRRQALDRCPSR